MAIPFINVLERLTANEEKSAQVLWDNALIHCKDMSLLLVYYNAGWPVARQERYYVEQRDQGILGRGNAGMLSPARHRGSKIRMTHWEKVPS